MRPRFSAADLRDKGGFRALLVNAVVVLMSVSTALAADPKVLALGDSLTAGYGLAGSDGFTRQIERALASAGKPAQVINGGVSGDTSAGGLARLDWALADKPDRVIVALGANDALRGLDPERTYANLDAILSRLRERRIPVLLVGMLAPPNLGPEYGGRFNGIYRRLAERHNVPLYPFMLDGVAANPDLNQADGMHPNARGVAVMVERMLPSVLKLIEAAP
jgi:acyl-CoA thioesterase-1